ncbi:MAG: hypothetical protein LQ350_002410 [Teloschistes chrysophthalmus]|nr:MAG: hypothetical protein LQ350_002410 [Niorma chrysophthalma]
MDRSSISSVDSEWDKSPSLPRQISPTGNDSSPAGNDSERYASLLAIARRHYVGKTRPPFAHFGRHIAVKHEGNEVTRTPAPRELSPSTSTIEREVSTSSPLTELESVTKRKQEIERQLEMIMALTNESRQLARREKELTRAASRSSGA